MDYMEHAKQLRNNTDIHYNCCQSVLVPFAKDMGLSEEQAFQLGAHFGAGMRHGSTCGALTGALMVLGALGYGEREAKQTIDQFRQSNGFTDCASLLIAAKERQQIKKENCDDLVCQCVAALKEITGK